MELDLKNLECILESVLKSKIMFYVDGLERLHIVSIKNDTCRHIIFYKILYMYVSTEELAAIILKTIVSKKVLSIRI